MHFRTSIFSVLVTEWVIMLPGSSQNQTLKGGMPVESCGQTEARRTAAQTHDTHSLRVPGRYS